MKKIITLGLFLLITNFCSSQNLKMLEQISTISFSNIDDVMINGYGFSEMKVDKKDTKEYGKIADQDINNFISIKILNTSNTPRNVLDVTIGPNHSISKFKNDLVENDYLYYGENEHGFLAYKKDDIYFLISAEPNAKGANQIILMPEQDPDN